MSTQQSKQASHSSGRFFAGQRVVSRRRQVAAANVLVTKTLEEEFAVQEDDEQLGLVRSNRAQGPVSTSFTSDGLAHRVEQVAGGWRAGPPPRTPPTTPLLP